MIREEVSGGSKVQILENSILKMVKTHGASAATTDTAGLQKTPITQLNHILKLVATGYTEHMHNNVETTLIDGRSVVNGRTCEISSCQVGPRLQPVKYPTLL